ncbi:MULTISPECIES: GcrA family cell cycle regulator [unclassified Methylobacterium]|jgi:GcrA cell cycle regulator|uniref:GcrA family cell cycle regulator n=1 Tax=unclassified Methylobacterium TaxID=2615210 RepID=UPI0011C1F5F5|nr:MULTISPECIES: GcrA family cell cycle regulator [unclassified Methylobacterium]QEE40235.1 GcrA cell cycle regulator [Methylobacterium sp. WL1]TXN58472.1 GcrA cell cycle regulator [Methylobacterium sp. WL2]
MEAGLSWTDDRVALLRRLWEDGQSASKIAAQLGGVTRNAVIGKVHRLGLGGRARGAEEAPASTPTPKAVEIETAIAVVETQAPEPVAILAHRPAPVFPTPAPAPEPVALAVSKRVTIMDLRESMCRWPLGDPTTPEFRFCGARSITGLPYCTHHAEIAYQPAAERKRDRRVASFR